jgi:hypothetical protein
MTTERFNDMESKLKVTGELCMPLLRELHVACQFPNMFYAVRDLFSFDAPSLTRLSVRLDTFYTESMKGFVEHMVAPDQQPKVTPAKKKVPAAALAPVAAVPTKRNVATADINIDTRLVHPTVGCDGCKGGRPMIGQRWKCTTCPDFDYWYSYTSHFCTCFCITTH